MCRIEKEFCDLDFKNTDFDDGGWTWGKGGAPLKDHEWAIIHIDKHLTETIYRCPKFISEMINLNGEWRRDELRREIKHILKI